MALLVQKFGGWGNGKNLFTVILRLKVSAAISSKGVGGKALMAQPSKKNFLRLPYRNIAYIFSM